MPSQTWKKGRKSPEGHRLHGRDTQSRIRQNLDRATFKWRVTMWVVWARFELVSEGSKPSIYVRKINRIYIWI